MRLPFEGAGATKLRLREFGYDASRKQKLCNKYITLIFERGVFL